MLKTSNNINTTNDDMKDELKKHIQGILSKKQQSNSNDSTTSLEKNISSDNIVHNSGDFFNNQNTQYSSF